ncbi:hypothetical protein ANCCAN_29767 [Ancylostoma caninum]|uniref:Uncharacterized protein n=1 Tax=Ancylostoma caninum TaxID=29170 RepID=A0A368F0R7_ANCCA|nr:hypothetical protein ANCCAN_29767 [Ancylostoma caninum]
MKIVKACIDPHLLNRKRPIRVVSCSNESMFMTKFVLTRTPTPSIPLLSQVPRNSSSPVSKVAFSGRCLLVSVSPMTSYLIFLACIIKSSMEASDASVRALKVQTVITVLLVLGSLDNHSDLVLTGAAVPVTLPRSGEHSLLLLCSEMWSGIECY